MSMLLRDGFVFGTLSCVTDPNPNGVMVWCDRVALPAVLKTLTQYICTDMLRMWFSVSQPLSRKPSIGWNVFCVSSVRVLFTPWA